MRFSNFLNFVPQHVIGRQASLALIGLGLGLIVLPAFIFVAGSQVLGRYDGASLGTTYSSIYGGLKTRSIAAWIMVLGPYGFYLLFKGLRYWWRPSSKLV